MRRSAAVPYDQRGYAYAESGACEQHGYQLRHAMAD
jgi:hypothetical protein